MTFSNVLCLVAFPFLLSCTPSKQEGGNEGISDAFDTAVSMGQDTSQGVVEGTSIVVSADSLPVPLPTSGTSGSSSTSTEVIDSGRILDVNFTVDLDHTCTKDLTAYLKSPNGTSVVLFDMSEFQVCSSDMEGTSFDDQAQGSIYAGATPFVGTYVPDGDLSDFNDEDPAGTWTLLITDDTQGDSGTLNSWTLELTIE